MEIAGRLAVAAALICLAGERAAAQDFEIPPASYPRLKDRSETPEGFAPPGWVVESQASGDLNGDAVADVVLVLRDTDPRNVFDDEGRNWFGSYPLDTNPRILAAAFGTVAGTYRLAMENHTLIRRHEQATLSDAYSDDNGVTVARGAFAVPLEFFANAGSWQMLQNRATFRYQNRRFELIGFDRLSLARNTGEEVAVSANYATGRIEITEGSMEDGDAKVSTIRLRPRRALGIEEIGDGLDFDPENPRADAR